MRSAQVEKNASKVLKAIFGFILFFLIGSLLGTFVFLIFFWFRPAQVIVPDVAGMSVDRAKQILQNAGLKVGQIHGEGLVQFTVPQEKSRVRKGRTVNLFCEEPRRLTVPNLVGAPRETAEVILQSMGFKVRIAQMPFKGADGRVMGIYPPVGTELKKGEEVSILIDVGEPGRD
ncbi:penicillin-binding protein [Pseudothermotoga hypogea DSM 11164 = NBRC 106472]|uniref:Penicillin-binding protein n=1 Tax=Pseudothermotoga hypogea DSM 11164 = NBRC 106472 TaxID=1123384 RepID=A0A0X1KQL3_9THEM|nr:PASTA domain-containing protein [Pseudothermotoga hypogea]AJC73529.1 penicillin-binding protein [Pseudothermotoga hypogea DSM 11164 = NBRC 106472]MBC7123691.1 PASTA domain-containing protein [Pseudothermotoga sp.]